MNLTQMKNTVLAVLAAAGSAVAQALGGWDVALKVLICFMALDYVTGWLVAAVWHKSAKSKTGALDSKASYKGLVKKGVMLALVWMAALVVLPLLMRYGVMPLWRDNLHSCSHFFPDFFINILCSYVRLVLVSVLLVRTLAVWLVKREEKRADVILSK